MGRRRFGRALRDTLDLEATLERVPTREGGEAPLLHPARRRIFVAVFDEPGTAVRPLARRIRIPAQTAVWHVDRLVKSGILRRRRVGRGSHLHADDLGSAEPWLAALQCDTCLRIARALRGRSRIQWELVRDLGTYAQALQHHLRRLEGAGVASRNRRQAWGLVRARNVVRSVEAAVPRRRTRLLAVLGASGLEPRVVGDRVHTVTIELTLPGRKERLVVPLIPRVVRGFREGHGPVGSS